MERVSFEESCAALRIEASTSSRPFVYMSVSQSSTTYRLKHMSVVISPSQNRSGDTIGHVCIFGIAGMTNAGGTGGGGEGGGRRVTIALALLPVQRPSPS